MTRPENKTRRLPWWILGPLFMATGVLLGQWLPLFGEVRAERVWSGAEKSEPSRQPPLAPTEGNRVVGLPSLAPVVDRVAKGVVTVRTWLPLGDGGEGDGVPSDTGVCNGSGFIVHRDGLVVTSHHLVARAMVIAVWIPGHRPVYAELVGEDPLTDLACIRLREPPPNLTVLELGPSEDLRAGDWIVNVGNPFDLPLSVTAGVVSFVGRHIQQYDAKVSNDFLQFSAEVNPGSSGSPVLDLAGRVVGVTTRDAVSAQGISFAIPSKTLKWVLDEMDASPDGRVRRGFLGVRFGPRSSVGDDYGPAPDGALILQVAESGPAAASGVQAGDVVLYYDDRKIGDAAELHESITFARPGTRARLTVLRDGRVIEPIEVELGEVASNGAAETSGS